MAIAVLTVLEWIWSEEGSPVVAGFWYRIRVAVEQATVADLAVALDVAHGLRDLGKRFPNLAVDLEDVAVRIEQRAWDRERRRLGIKPVQGASR